MFIQDLLTKCNWTVYGVECPDANMTAMAHKFLREAILDRHLFVCKVIGFDFTVGSMSRAHAGTYIARNKQIGESYAEVMLNMSDKVLLTTSNGDITVEITDGQNTVHNVTFENSEHQPVPILYTNENVCRVLDKSCLLKLKVVYDCGYRTCQQNSKKIGADYFPCYTDFYVGDFFRVLPPEPGNIVAIRFYNGGTIEMLKLLFERYLQTILAGGLRKEEREWLRGFMQ